MICGLQCKTTSTGSSDGHPLDLQAVHGRLRPRDGALVRPRRRGRHRAYRRDFGDADHPLTGQTSTKTLDRDAADWHTPLVSLALLVSFASLLISAVTLWLTNFRRGRLRMTMPSIVFFGFDDRPKLTAKIFVRTLLYSTSTRGQVIESMFATLHHEGRAQDFAFWGFGPVRELAPGGGLYIDKSGVAANHHFVLSVHEQPYWFSNGDYDVDIFARTASHAKPVKLARIPLHVGAELAIALSKNEGVLFERRPNGDYEGHADPRPK